MKSGCLSNRSIRVASSRERCRRPSLICHLSFLISGCCPALPADLEEINEKWSMKNDKSEASGFRRGVSSAGSGGFTDRKSVV